VERSAHGLIQALPGICLQGISKTTKYRSG